jgi:hypothetical protein
MRTPERTNNKKQRITLLGVIANGSTGNARRLLKKYNIPDAVNHQDLEMKLSKLYANTDDKIQFEQELAELHPHKDFILKNLKPIKPTEPDAMVTEANSITKQMATDTNSSGCSCGNPNCNNNITSNACGCSKFNGYSNAGGSCSGVDGTGSTQPISMNNGIMVLGIIGIISIFALALKK